MSLLAVGLSSGTHEEKLRTRAIEVLFEIICLVVKVRRKRNYCAIFTYKLLILILPGRPFENLVSIITQLAESMNSCTKFICNFDPLSVQECREEKSRDEGLSLDPQSEHPTSQIRTQS